MWSKNPMPVLMLIRCDLLAWAAWPSAPLASSLESVSGGSSPPSRFRASWILVSFVSRAMAAHRGFDGEAMLWEWTLGTNRKVRKACLRPAGLIEHRVAALWCLLVPTKYLVGAV